MCNQNEILNLMSLLLGFALAVGSRSMMSLPVYESPPLEARVVGALAMSMAASSVLFNVYGLRNHQSNVASAVHGALAICTVLKH